jgi:hypothetical protein
MCPLPVQPSRPRPLHFAAQQMQADQLRRPRSPSPLLLSFHPLTAMAHVSPASSLSSSFLCPASDVAALGDLCRSRARGMGCSPVRLARTPRGRCARMPTSWTRPRDGNSPFAPLRAPLHRSWRGGSRRRLSRPAGPSQGSLGLSPRSPRHQASKVRQGRGPSAQATNPHWGFPIFTSEHAVRGRERARRHRHCVEPRRYAVHRSAADAPRPESATTVTRRGEEAVCAWGGAGLGAGTSTPP